MNTEEMINIHNETLRDWWDEFEKEENIHRDRLPDIPLTFAELVEEMDKRNL